MIRYMQIMQTVNSCNCRSRSTGWNSWETALPAGKVRWEPSMRKIGSVPFSLRKIRIPVWWQMHYPQSIVWYLRAAGELSPDGMEMWRIRFLRFTHRSVAYSPGRGMLLWERWKTMISKHGSRLHPGVKAHQITAKEIETYLQELL